MRLLLDTNRYSDLVARELAVLQRFRTSAEVWLSPITLGELRAGFVRGNQNERNEAKLSAMTTVQGVRVLQLDDDTTHHYAAVVRQLRRNGTMIPTNDIWIAAQALQHNLTLDTRDDHFKKVEGLKLV